MDDPHMCGLFGYEGEIENGVHFFNESTVLYFAGPILVFHDIPRKCQSDFLPCADHQEIVSVGLSSNRRFLFVNDCQPSVSVYDLEQQKKRRTLTSPAETEISLFISVAFSPDARHIAAQGSDPEWILILWDWEKNRVLATLQHPKLGPESEIHQVFYHPADPNRLAAIGRGTLRQYTFTEGTLKPQAIAKREKVINAIRGAWLPEDKVLIGTDEGSKLMLWVGEKTFEIPNSCAWECVSHIVVWKQFVACACASACEVMVHEATDKLSTIGRAKLPSFLHKQCITSLAFEKNQIIVGTDCNQLYLLQIPTLTRNKTWNPEFRYLAYPIQTGPITALDGCKTKNLAVTCGEDGSLMLWNYVHRNVLLYETFPTLASCVSIHPLGLLLLAGFPDKLRLYSIQLERLKFLHEIDFALCQKCSFNDGGNVFAVARNSEIQLLSTTTLQILRAISTQENKVINVLWVDDSTIKSCTNDGRILEWGVASEKVTDEHSLKGCLPVDFTFNTSKNVFLGSDKIIRVTNNFQQIEEFGDVEFSCISISSHQIFGGSRQGKIHRVGSRNNSWLAHSSPVVNMMVLGYDEYLLSCDEKGCTILWKLAGESQKVESPYAKEMLASQDDISTMKERILELEEKVVELQQEQEYQIDLKEMHHLERVEDVCREHQLETQKLRDQIVESEKFLEKKFLLSKAKAESVAEEHQKQYQEQEDKYAERLLYEYKRYEMLHKDAETNQVALEQQLKQLETDKGTKIQNLGQKYDEKIDVLKCQLEEMRTILEKVHSKHKQEKLDVQDEAKQKLHSQRTRYDVLLAAERERGILDKNELAVLRKKVSHLQKEVQEKKTEIETLRSQHDQQQTCIRSLVEDIERYKQELLERDGIIRRQERVVTAMKIKQRETEKLTSLLELRQATSREASTDIESFRSEQQTLSPPRTTIRLHPVHVPQLTEKVNMKQNKSL